MVLAGVPLEAARMAALLVHGRDQDEREMLDVAARLGVAEVAYVLPIAAGRSWYPGRYFDPLPVNEPWLERALDACDAAVARAHRAGMPDERIVVAGFSQGALDDAVATARAFEAVGASVTFETYEDRAHHINDRAVDGLRRLLRGVKSAPSVE
jgi:phospholipase/carboxylesterase